MHIKIEKHQNKIVAFDYIKQDSFTISTTTTITTITNISGTVRSGKDSTEVRGNKKKQLVLLLGEKRLLLL
jgi:hypothetical protein